MTHMPRSLIALSAIALAATVVAARHRPVEVPVSVVQGAPTFDKEVVRIFQQHCQSCHHPGDIAPFSLMDYSSAKLNAAAIKLMTRTHQMPPWKPTAGCGDFAEARVMSDAEINTIAKWVDGGAPEGSAADLPKPLDFSSGWLLGQPDLVAANPQPYTPPADGDMYRCFSIPTNLTSDAYVAGIDVHPGDRATVHHVIAYIDTTGESAKLETTTGAGYQCFGGPGFSITNASASTLGGWAPGAQPTKLPDGVSFLLPAASRIVLQVHYHSHDGKPKADQTQIGVYYSKVKPSKLMRILPLINTTFTIPPNDPSYKVTANLPIPMPIGAHLWFIAPHMHLLGRKMNVQATLPNGTQQCLINIDDWDFNWQGIYRYNQPIAIPAGTRLGATAWFDNSDSNPRNPNSPPKAVSWGEATTDEMCIAFLGVTLDSENLSN